MGDDYDAGYDDGYENVGDDAADYYNENYNANDDAYYAAVQDDQYYAAVEEEAIESCKVYDTDDFFTTFVQILLALIALFSLFVKRQNEVPRREFMTWWLDVSKQGIGAIYQHCLNMITASIISHNVRGDYELEDQCAWYAINYFFDTTVGLFLSVILLQMALGAAKRRNIASLMNTGVYSGADGMKHWWHQLIFWMLILSACKVLLLALLWICSPLLARLGYFVFGPLQGNNQLELLFVMIILPGVLNVFYFWIADGYLKADTEEAGKEEEPATISKYKAPIV